MAGVALQQAIDFGASGSILGHVLDFGAGGVDLGVEWVDLGGSTIPTKGIGL